MSRLVMAAIAVTGLLTGAQLVSSTAQAAPAAIDNGSGVHVTGGDVRVTAGISGKKARTLADALGESRTGGVYLNASGRMVVAVTDQAGAQAVRQAGGVAEQVKYSTTKLKSIHAELDKLAGIPGTSWGVDPSTNQVSVELDSTVDAAKTAKLKAVTDKFGDAVRVERIPGKSEKKIYSTGGEMIATPIGGRLTPWCSLGFNVTNAGGDRYFITAGHCTNDHENWYQGWSGAYLGNRVRSSYPGNDYGVVKYNNTSVIAYGTVHHNTQQIRYSGWPYDGEKVSRAGGVSNDLIGQVLLTDTTATYSNGETVYHVIKTSNCIVSGDSGGALYDGDVALGIASGGNGDDAPCSDNVSDKRSYYQPLQEVLNTYNLSVY